VAFKTHHILIVFLKRLKIQHLQNIDLAAIGFNLRKMLQQLKAEALNSFWIF